MFAFLYSYRNYIAGDVNYVLYGTEQHLGIDRYSDQSVRLKEKDDNQHADNDRAGLVWSTEREEQYKDSYPHDMQPRNLDSR